ncbi:MAG: YaiI/YqxD family protein [Pseudomonadales bacterium]|nr:YaiI/YqxD family protein [Pseudomonadales bacterium]
MTIWIDADACPVVIREIICGAANRTGTETIFVANSFIKLPPSPHIRFMQVPKGFDVADNEIAARAVEGDLVITSDIPLAAEVMEKKTEAINTRGEPYSEDTIRQRLNMRDFMDTMRSSGVQSGGPPPLGQAEKQAFANALDRYLARKSKQESK